MTIADVNSKIAEKVVKGYKAVENTVTGNYKKVENAFTGGYKKIEDKFVDKFLRKDGETTEEAKTRIEHEQAEHKAKQETEAKARAEKITKTAGTKTTEQIQAEIKAKHNL